MQNNIIINPSSLRYQLERGVLKEPSHEDWAEFMRFNENAATTLSVLVGNTFIIAESLCDLMEEEYNGLYRQWGQKEFRKIAGKFKEWQSKMLNGLSVDNPIKSTNRPFAERMKNAIRQRKNIIYLSYKHYYSSEKIRETLEYHIKVAFEKSGKFSNPILAAKIQVMNFVATSADIHYDQEFQNIAGYFHRITNGNNMVSNDFGKMFLDCFYLKDMARIVCKPMEWIMKLDHISVDDLSVILNDHNIYVCLNNLKENYFECLTSDYYADVLDILDQKEDAENIRKINKERKKKEEKERIKNKDFEDSGNIGINKLKEKFNVSSLKRK